MGDAAAWGAPAGVWHGFTQMASYLDNEPIIVEAAEGRELIDVDGRRYLDAISSLWVTMLGHRVPELDRALREQLDRVAHSTLLGNGNRVVAVLAEAPAREVPVDRPQCGVPTAGARAAGAGDPPADRPARDVTPPRRPVGRPRRRPARPAVVGPRVPRHRGARP